MGKLGYICKDYGWRLISASPLPPGEGQGEGVALGNLKNQRKTGNSFLL